MNIKKAITVGFMAVAASALALDYCEVIDVSARQRYPWNGLVDIDFELELLRTDTINVDYIIQLIADLDLSSPSFEHDRGRILKIMKETEHLRSKIELIEKFIDEKLGNIDTKQTNVFEAFDTFMREERKAAFCSIIEEEELKEDVARRVIDIYEFSGKFNDDLIKKSFKNELKFRERKIKVNNIKHKIEDVFEKFTY